MALRGKRETIAETFMEMLRETSLESLRVQELAERAGISKATFYRLFKDKYDVMNWIYLGVTEPVVTAQPDLSSWKQWSNVMLAHIKKNQAFYRSILTYEGQNSFAESMSQYFMHNILSGIRQRLGVQTLPDDLMFVIQAFSQVNVFAVTQWIQNGCKPSPETLVQYVEKCIPECLRPYYS